jgi:hypothetical protein
MPSPICLLRLAYNLRMSRSFHYDVVSGFSRTVSGPPEGGHYIDTRSVQ